MSDNDRILVLVSAGRTKRYPLPAGDELKDQYEIDGRTWTVADVLTHRAAGSGINHQPNQPNHV